MAKSQSKSILGGIAILVVASRIYAAGGANAVAQGQAVPQSTPAPEGGIARKAANQSL
jgi:hypothetical protein